MRAKVPNLDLPAAADDLDSGLRGNPSTTVSFPLPAHPYTLIVLRGPSLPLPGPLVFPAFPLR